MSPFELQLVAALREIAEDECAPSPAQLEEIRTLLAEADRRASAASKDGPAYEDASGRFVMDLRFGADEPKG